MIAITAATRPCDPATIVEQIGRMNVAAISGGRVGRVVKGNDIVGIDLPVSNGYHVSVVLDASDTYTVRRLFIRGSKVFNKGTITGVYCDELAEVAYAASCFRSYEFGENR